MVTNTIPSSTRYRHDTDAPPARHRRVMCSLGTGDGKRVGRLSVDSRPTVDRRVGRRVDGIVFVTIPLQWLPYFITLVMSTPFSFKSLQENVFNSKGALVWSWELIWAFMVYNNLWNSQRLSLQFFCWMRRNKKKITFVSLTREDSKSEIFRTHFFLTFNFSYNLPTVSIIRFFFWKTKRKSTTKHLELYLPNKRKVTYFWERSKTTILSWRTLLLRAFFKGKLSHVSRLPSLPASHNKEREGRLWTRLLLANSVAVFVTKVAKRRILIEWRSPL